MAATRTESGPIYFDIPDGMHKIFMDPVTGRKMDGRDKSAVRALFVEGTGPK